MTTNGTPRVSELEARIRELEALKKSRTDEATRIISSQRSTIDRLRAENQRLAADLASVGSTDATAIAALVSTGSAAVPVMVKPTGLTPAQLERADKLTEVADTYSRKIEVEQRQLESLEREVEQAQAQLLAARRDIGGHSGTQAVCVAPVKAIKALETRLDVTQRRFNEHIAANRDLKQQIDAATRRQAGMEQVRAHLEREVAGVAGELAAVHEATRVAQEAKQEAVAQAAALRIAEDAEAAAFEAEVRALAACQAADEKLLQAQAVRLTKVVEAAEAAEAVGGSGASEPLDLDAFEQQGGGVEEAVAQLQQAAGLSSLPEVLTHYRGLEAASFELFTACGQANDRITALGREVAALQGEVRQLESDVVAGRQHEAIRQVLSRRDAAQRRLESLGERRAAIERRLMLLRAGISSCLRKLGAAATAQAWDSEAPPPPRARESASGVNRSTGGGHAAAAAPSAPSITSTISAATPADDPTASGGLHPALLTCGHVLVGLGLLEQRAAAIIAVQGTLVGRISGSNVSIGSGRALGSVGGASRPGSATTLGSVAGVPGGAAAGILGNVAVEVSTSGATGGGGSSATAAFVTSGGESVGLGERPNSTSGGGDGGGAAGGALGDDDDDDDDEEDDEEDEDEEEDEEDEVPLTREQIQSRSASLRQG